MKWEFTPDEFMHVWKETGLDRYPFPLRLLASVRWEDEFDALARELRNRLPLGRDPDLSAMLRVAAHPETALALFGTRRRPVRAYGAIVTTVGVTMVQRPGVDAEFGGNVIVQVGSPAIVANVFAAVLGDVPPGDVPAMVERVERLRAVQQAQHIVNGAAERETAADRIVRLLAAPRAGFGHLQVSREESDPEHLSWIDVENDGRYFYRYQQDDIYLAPGTPQALRKEIARLAGLAS